MDNIIKKLIEENEWLPKAIEMLNMRLIDRGFNVLDQWLGFYDEYCLVYVPEKLWNGEYYEELNWGKLEIHSKTNVFNPYKFCGGYGYEFKKLTEMNMKEKHWNIIKEYIVFNDYKINDKKVDVLSDPYYKRIEFIDGSDVPINNDYE